MHLLGDASNALELLKLTSAASAKAALVLQDHLNAIVPYHYLNALVLFHHVNA